MVALLYLATRYLCPQCVPHLEACNHDKNKNCTLHEEFQLALIKSLWEYEDDPPQAPTAPAYPNEAAKPSQFGPGALHSMARWPRAQPARGVSKIDKKDDLVRFCTTEYARNRFLEVQVVARPAE